MLFTTHSSTWMDVGQEAPNVPPNKKSLLREEQAFHLVRQELAGDYVGGLKAFGAFLNRKFNGLTFGQ